METVICYLLSVQQKKPERSFSSVSKRYATNKDWVVTRVAKWGRL